MLNIYSTVSGGGMLGQNTGFDVVNTFPGPSQFCTKVREDDDRGEWTKWLDGTMEKIVCTDTRLTVQTVPPGLGAIVDGSQFPTPHWFLFYVKSIHTFQEPASLIGSFVFSSGLTTNVPGCVNMPDMLNSPPVWQGEAPPNDGNYIFDASGNLVTLPNVEVVSNTAGKPPDVNQPTTLPATTGVTLKNTFAVFVQAN